jgi:hypothetical protein
MQFEFVSQCVDTSRGVFIDLTISRLVCFKTDNGKEHSN